MFKPSVFTQTNKKQNRGLLIRLGVWAVQTLGQGHDSGFGCTCGDLSGLDSYSVGPFSVVIVARVFFYFIYFLIGRKYQYCVQITMYS